MNKGTLRRWNDERGFGFIVPEHGGADVFVHISTFPRDGVRPNEGELLYYTVINGKGNKPKASYVERLQKPQLPAKQRTIQKKSSMPTEKKMVGSLTLLVLIAIIFYGYKQYTAWQHRLELQGLPPTTQITPPIDSPVTITKPIEPIQSVFQCDGRIHCSQMTSCTEAKWFLNNCPGTKMDGDGDGIPCEEQLCGH